VPSLYKAEIAVELAQGILKFQTRAIVVAYAVNKKNTLHGLQTTAEALCLAKILSVCDFNRIQRCSSPANCDSTLA
jgi:hypothetical protein